MNLLIVDSAVTGAASVSRRLTDRIAERVAAAVPGARVVRRDVGAEPLPHLAPETVAAIRGTAATDAERAALDLSDALVAEVMAADAIVIGAPMYNFGLPSTLKAWFDHVLRAGVTFRYGPDGPEGLAGDKPVIVVETRGGLYSEGPAAAMDAQEPHLRAMLGFIGLRDVRFIRVERLALGAEAAAAAVADAITEIDSIDLPRPALAA